MSSNKTPAFSNPHDVTFTYRGKPAVLRLSKAGLNHSNYPAPQPKGAAAPECDVKAKCPWHVDQWLQHLAFELYGICSRYNEALVSLNKDFQAGRPLELAQMSRVAEEFDRCLSSRGVTIRGDRGLPFPLQYITPETPQPPVFQIDIIDGKERFSGTVALTLDNEAASAEAVTNSSWGLITNFEVIVTEETEYARSQGPVAWAVNSSSSYYSTNSSSSGF